MGGSKLGEVPHTSSGGFPLLVSVNSRENKYVAFACASSEPFKMMEYVYYLANASLTLRVVEYLHSTPWLPVRFMTVIHQIDGWVVKVKLSNPLSEQQDGDFRAFLNELGIPYEPEIRVRMALWGLETGQSPVDVMRRYQVAVVSHGSPDRSEIEEFRKQFVQGLGYCPETLA